MSFVHLVSAAALVLFQFFFFYVSIQIGSRKVFNESLNLQWCSQNHSNRNLSVFHRFYLSVVFFFKFYFQFLFNFFSPQFCSLLFILFDMLCHDANGILCNECGTGADVWLHRPITPTTANIFFIYCIELSCEAFSIF